MFPVASSKLVSNAAGSRPDSRAQRSAQRQSLPPLQEISVRLGVGGALSRNQRAIQQVVQAEDRGREEQVAEQRCTKERQRSQITSRKTRGRFCVHRAHRPRGKVRKNEKLQAR